MHVPHRLSLQRKRRDAIIDEDGETAATSNRGVVADDSLVAIKCVRVSVVLTDASLEREGHRCTVRIAAKRSASIVPFGCARLSTIGCGSIH
jgi:hypothetical protein